MNVMIGAARLEFFFLLDDRRWRRDHDLLDLVHAAAFLAAFHLENETVLLRKSCVAMSGSIVWLIGENVQSSISSSMSDAVLDADLRRQILDDDRRLDVDDFFVLDFRISVICGNRYGLNRRGRLQPPDRV